MKPQELIEDIYRHIDRANEILVSQGCGFTIVRSLEVMFEDTKELDPPPPAMDLERPSEAVPWTGDCCYLCGGMLVQTGKCATCQQCGESSGDCS